MVHADCNVMHSTMYFKCLVGVVLGVREYELSVISNGYNVEAVFVFKWRRGSPVDVDKGQTHRWSLLHSALELHDYEDEGCQSDPWTSCWDE